MLFDMIAPTPLIPGTRIYVDWAEIEESFLAAALITVIIEVPLFYFCGYRKPKNWRALLLSILSVTCC